MAVSTFLVGVGIFVKIRNRHRGPNGKFKNPLPNINLTIATVNLFSTLLLNLARLVDLPKDLLFPRVHQGFHMVAMLAIFFFSSPDMKAHAVRRFPCLKMILRGNSIQPERGGAGNEMQLNILAKPPAGDLTIAGALQ